MSTIGKKSGSPSTGGPPPFAGRSETGGGIGRNFPPTRGKSSARVEERAMAKRKSDKNQSIGRIVLGLYLMLIGSLILASTLGYDLPKEIWHWWPFLLIAGGGAKMIFGGREGLADGFWITLGGFYCWVSVWNLWGLSWGTAWPIFVVAGGLSMILEPWFGKAEVRLERKRGEEKEEVAGVD
jgi:hypothetical protein